MGLVVVRPCRVILPGVNAMLRMSPVQELVSAKATGRQRGDGSRPSGNSSDSRPKNRTPDGHNTQAIQPTIRAAGSDPGVTMAPRTK
jgi:hypothetical protein